MNGKVNAVTLGLANLYTNKVAGKLSREMAKLEPEKPDVYSGVVVAFNADENHVVKVSCGGELTGSVIHQGINFVPPLATNGNSKGVYFSRTNNGRIAINGTVTVEGAEKTNIAYYLIPFAKPVYFPAGKYVISSDLFDVSGMFTGASGGVRVMTKNADGTINYINGFAYEGNNVVFELAEPAPVFAEIRLQNVVVGAKLDATCYAQIEMGETASEFVPYQRAAYTQFPTEFFAYDGENVVYSDTFTPVDVEVMQANTDRALNKIGVAADSSETGKRIAKYGKTPQEYGAVGDGVTDDTQAIQRCLDENAVTYLPVGRYRITYPLNMGSGKTLFGHNRAKTLIVCDNCDCIHFAEGASNGYIGGIAFIGDNTVNKGFVFAKNVQHWTIEDIIAQKFGDTFFYANNVGYVGVIQFVNSSFTYGGKSCFEFICDAVSQINSIDIRGCEISHFPNGNAININGVRLNVTSNTIQTVQNGINIQPSLLTSAETSGINTNAMMIVSNYFEQVSGSCIRVMPLADTTGDRHGYVVGLVIVGNYGWHIEQDTPAVKFEHELENNFAYSMYAPHGDALVRNCIYAGNHFFTGGGVLIDGGNILQNDTIIIADSEMSDRKQYIDAETTPYTLVNMGNACVRSKYAFAKETEHIRNAFVQGTSVATSEDVTLQPSASLYYDMRHTGIVKVDISHEITQQSDGAPQIKVYGQLRSGETLCTCSIEMVGSETVLRYPEFITDTNTGTEYPSEEFVAYTIVIEANGSVIKVGNPVVKYIPN